MSVETVPRGTVLRALTVLSVSFRKQRRLLTVVRLMPYFERVSMEFGIKRPNVYPYMKSGKKRLAPNAETTTKIISALRRRAHDQALLPILEPAIERMRISAKIY
jgi:hypothetical protein